MKNLILILACLASTSAFATKARMRALNQDTNGSYYLMDTRNIFLNPAQIGAMKDNVNLEWGRRERTDVYTPSADAEGGFVMQVGPGKLAAQLGRATDFSRFVRDVNVYMSDIPTNLGLTTFGEGQNNVDVMYGGGGDMRWGGGIGIQRSKMATGVAAKTTNVQAVELRGGVQTDKWEGYGGLTVGAQSETELATTTAKLDQDIALKGGAGYQIRNDMRVYGRLIYNSFSAKVADTFNYDGSELDLLGGFAYIRNLENNARFFADAELNSVSASASDSKNNPKEKFNMLQVPVTLGIEADANTWLRMRGSVRQNVLIGHIKTSTGGTADDNNYWENAPNNTAVAFGLGSSMNKFNFDATLVQGLGDDHGRVEGSMTYVF